MACKGACGHFGEVNLLGVSMWLHFAPFAAVVLILKYAYEVLRADRRVWVFCGECLTANIGICEVVP